MPAGQVGFEPAGYVHLVWGPGSYDSTQAQALFEEVVRLLQVTGCGQLLTDQRQRVPATEAYMGWLLSNWLPRVGDSQLLSRVAVVASRPLELRLQAVDVCRQGELRYGMVSRFFSTPEQAHRWLQEPRGTESAG